MRGLPPFSLFFALSLAQSALSRRAELAKSDDDCNCFLTNGSTPEYYTSHLFFDFRSLADDASVPDVITSYSESGTASATSKYFKSDEWNDVWSLQGWNNSKEDGKGLSGDATVKMVNSPNNVYIQANDDKNADSDTFMTMRTQRLPKFQTAAEFESNDNYHYLSLRMLARTVGSPGAVIGMFTYLDPSDGDSDSIAKVQEADIEILTRGPRNKISYTNQPAFDDDGEDIPKATRNATLPGGIQWDEWAVHRLDWSPGSSVWYIDGKQVAKITFQAPKDPAQVIFNAWSDGGSWSGVMPKHDEAFLQIKWIEMVYNTTKGADEGEDRRRRRSAASLGPRGPLSKRTGEGACKAVCSIDETTEFGKAVVLSGNGASALFASWSLRITAVLMTAWLAW